MTQTKNPVLSAGSTSGESRYQNTDARCTRCSVLTDDDNAMAHRTAALEQEVKELHETLYRRESQLLRAKEQDEENSATIEMQKSEIARLNAELSYATNNESADDKDVDLELERKKLAGEVQDLEARVNRLIRDVNDRDARIADLEEQIEILEPIADAAGTFRRAFVYRCFGKFTDTGFKMLHGVKDRPLHRHVTRARNSLSHYGQWELDHLLAKLGIFSPEDKVLLKKVYQQDIDTVVRPDIVNVLNMHANMFSHGAGTELTVNSEDDRAFAKDFWAFKEIYLAERRKVGNDQQALGKFLSSNAQAKKLISDMRLIDQKTSWTYRNRLRGSFKH